MKPEWNLVSHSQVISAQKWTLTRHLTCANGKSLHSTCASLSSSTLLSWWITSFITFHSIQSNRQPLSLLSTSLNSITHNFIALLISLQLLYSDKTITATSHRLQPFPILIFPSATFSSMFRLPFFWLGEVEAKGEAVERKVISKTMARRRNEKLLVVKNT